MDAWAIVGIVIGILALIVLVKMWPEQDRELPSLSAGAAECQSPRYLRQARTL